MPTRKLSAASSRNTKSRSAELSPLGRRIAAGLREGIAHNKGEITLPTRFYIPEEIDVKSIRAKLGLSQSEFAERYGFSPRSLQDWEQDRRKPESAVRAYLLVIDSAPDLVEKALIDKLAS
jgi:putative transcriptional regulator